ncbi:hypothetical protein CHU98_g342 [Xylaria longipes]|nr:hypothetical protein CHU98_g342 [Xylaria longipes]
MPVASEINETNGVAKTNGISKANGINETNGSNGTNSRTLHIPDLFGGILSGDPVENPLEPTIGFASEEWTKALAAPQGNNIHEFPFPLRTRTDDLKPTRLLSAWQWIGVYGPLFLMTRNPAPVNKDLQQRWKETHRRCLYAILQQVWLAQSKTGLDVSIPDYMQTRRESIGSYCLFVVVEWAHGIKLTQDIMDHPSISTCERAAADLTWLVNDVLSYKKDLAFGVEHNIICLLMRQGCSEQEAMDKTGEIMDQCQKDWDDAVANLPSWGEETDKEVQSYLGACRDVARANLWWSFRSGRYLNAEEAVLARTQKTLTLTN